MNKRNPQLDVLRCAAILGVLVAHTVYFRAPRSWWENLLVRPGWTGVDLFFVISGFLISGLLFAEFQKRGRIHFGRFAMRRALKLYPMLYVLVLGVMFVRLKAAGFHDIGWIVRPALHDIFFVQSYLRGTYGHFWSLAVEEHFYVLLPLTLYFMLRKSRAGEPDPLRRLPSVLLLVAVFCFGARLVHAVMVPSYSPATHMFPTHLRLDSLSFGVLLSYHWHFHSDEFAAQVKQARPFLFLASLALIAPAIILDQSNFIMYTVGLSFLNVGYGGLMIAFLHIPMATKGFLSWLIKAAAYIGQHSYPIYLFHFGIMQQLLKHGLLRNWTGLLVYFVSAITIGVLISKLIEYPVLQFRDRIFPPMAPPALSRSDSSPASRKPPPPAPAEIGPLPPQSLRASPPPSRALPLP